MDAPVLAVAYILGHTPGGFEVDINTAKIISMHRARADAKNKNVTDTVRCVIHTDDGRFTSVTESCVDILRMIAKGEKP
jgi:hypothetical protein